MRKQRQLAVMMMTALLSGCMIPYARPGDDGPHRRPPIDSSAELIEIHERPPVLPMPPVVDILSPNFNERNGKPITAIVLHHTASTADAVSIARWFQRREANVSAHYIVDRDGSVVRCVPDDKRAWHAGPSEFQGQTNVNDFSIGIEICNRGDNVEPYPPVQVAAVSRLVAALAQRHEIPVGRITRHRDVIRPVGAKVDPSDNFDFDWVVAQAQVMLAGNGTPTAAGRRRQAGG